jgi:hypothetical protein
MGTVHGVYLKYVGLSALSYTGYSILMKNEDRMSVGKLMGESLSLLGEWMTYVPALVLGYSAVVNAVIAILFKLEVGMGLIGKDKLTGQIPTWSYIIFFPFHVPTKLYTHLHTVHDHKKKDIVPVATEVQPGWWIGGCYGHRLDKDWAGVIDLTVEFPEKCINRTRAYFSTPTWDGVPAPIDQIEEAASFAVTASQQGGPVLVHCAHGRGRSTTIMCACLVKAGLFPTWEEAFAQGIKPYRSCCSLNKRMRENLKKWQETYVSSHKKGE